MLCSRFLPSVKKGGVCMDDYTRKFSIAMEKDAEIRHILTTVYQALEEKGYNPINQIVGYILSEDPTYITNHNNARTLIRKIEGEEITKNRILLDVELIRGGTTY